jgi:DNA-binding transcriptional ArsR family regulator
MRVNVSTVVRMFRMADDRCELLCLNLDVAERLRTHRLAASEAEGAAARARALGDPTRLMLAGALEKAEELCVCDLAWIAERSQNLVSHHLRALRTAGLVRSRRDGKMIMYSLTEEGRELLAAVAPARVPATA